MFDKLGYGEKEVEEITSYFWNYHPNFIKYFLHSMNMVAKEIGLTDSYFDSPCGSENNIYNLSTARDMCLLADAVMNEPELRQMVCCKQHCCDPVDRKASGSKPWEKHKSKATFVWENTNQLVTSRGGYFKGCSSGNTNSSGPCVAAAFQNRRHDFILVALNTESLKGRWTDAQKLA